MRWLVPIFGKLLAIPEQVTQIGPMLQGSPSITVQDRYVIFKQSKHRRRRHFGQKPCSFRRQQAYVMLHASFKRSRSNQEGTPR